MPVHQTEPVTVHALPIGPGGRDLVVAAADEVPPHDEVVGERLTTQQQQPRLGRGGQLQLVASVAEVEEDVRFELGAGSRECTLEKEYAVLEVGSQRKSRRRPSGEL